MSRVYNFCAGPAALPEAVLTRAQEELLEWQGQGASVMELSHRSKAFMDVMEQAESRLRRLLGVSDDYAVLFQQGGASQQFAAVPNKFNLFLFFVNSSACSTNISVSGLGIKTFLSTTNSFFQNSFFFNKYAIGLPFER